MIKKIIPLSLICITLACSSALGASQTAHSKMSGGLSSLIAKRADSFVKKRGLAGEKRDVVFYTKDIEATSGYVASHGGSVLRRFKDSIIARVPLDGVEEIVDNARGVGYARLPLKITPHAITSEGVGVTGASVLHGAGVKGEGVKIAVIDVGFKGLSAAQSNGDLPADVVTCDFSGKGLTTQYKHGTACAETIYDMAPKAKIYLLKVGDEASLYTAFDYCKNNAIDIVSMSIGTFGSGPGDGTGSVDEGVDDLKANGILVVASAGNGGNVTEKGVTGGTHWQGAFTSGGNYNNDTHEFIQGDAGSWYSVIASTPCKDDDGTSLTDDLPIVMRWDDWPSATTDYDMYLYNYNYFSDTLGGLVASSTAIQNGSQQPIEGIVVDIPDESSYIFYALVIKKKSGEPAGKDLEILLGGESCMLPRFGYSSAFATSSSSICEPADAQSAIAVGAINCNTWTAGPQEEYSSQGPTNAWAGSSARIKPDICGPDATSSLTYGTSGDNLFTGTSAAAPHVTGAAALILSMHPQYSVDQLRTAIEVNAVDLGSSGKDNIYGNGRVRLDTPLNTLPVLEWAGEAGYTIDGLEPEAGNGSTTFTFKIKYKDADGDAPNVHDIYIDKDGDGDYADAGEVSSMTATGSDYKTGVVYTCVTNIPCSAGGSNCSYYFKFSDNIGYAAGNITGAMSPQTAINKPDVFQALSISIDHSDWQLSSIPAGSTYVTDNTLKIRVTNTGDGAETYSLMITSAGNGWTASSDKNGADINTFVLSAAFSVPQLTGISGTCFNEIGSDDVVPMSVAARASSTRFGSDRLGDGGFAVSPASDRNLWLEFKAPVKDTMRISQSISVTINAEAP